MEGEEREEGRERRKKKGERANGERGREESLLHCNQISEEGGRIGRREGKEGGKRGRREGREGGREE